MQQPWTASELALLRERYPDTPTAELAHALGRSAWKVYGAAWRYGLRKSAAYLASPAACRTNGRHGIGTRWVPGQPPWNKGMHYMPGGRSAETRFGSGNAPANRCEVGALRLNADGGLDIKAAPGARQWVPLARFVWRTERGAIPAGMVVAVRNGDAYDTRIDNLELVSRAELMRRNAVQRFPKALMQLVQLRGVLNRQIKNRSIKHAHSERSSRPPVRDAGGAARQGRADGRGPRARGV